MKANRKFEVMKAIAFIFVAVSIFSCTSCDPEITLDPQFSGITAENVDTTSITLVCSLKPNGNQGDIWYEYQTGTGTWVGKQSSVKISGTEDVKITLYIPDLQPKSVYNFRISLKTASRTFPSGVYNFTTLEFPKSVVIIQDATNVGINTAVVNGKIVAKYSGAKASFDIKESSQSSWTNYPLSQNYSSSDTAKVTLDLSGLKANTKFDVRLKSIDKAGEVISDTIHFETYAVADYDGNLYHTVTIGTQTWLRENLRTTHYANGDPIVNITSNTGWANATSGAYCWYNNDPEIGKVYGALYNYWVGVDPRGLIIGWHTPSRDEFQVLRDFNYSGNVVALAIMEAGHEHWGETAKEANNSTGFTALPNGCRLDDTGSFSDLKTSASFFGSSYDGFANFAYIDAKPISLFECRGWGSLKGGLGLRLIK